MRRRLVALLCPAFVACGGAPPIAAPPAAEPIPAVRPAAPAPEAPPPRAERPNRCLPNGLPKPRVPKKIYAGDTCVDHRKAEAVLSRKLAKQYRRGMDGSSVDVAFGCDPLTQGVEEVVIESGYGHGGGLALHRLRRTEDDSAFDIVSLVLPGYLSAGERAPQIGGGRIDVRAFSAAFDTAQPALTAIIRELEPPPKPNAILGRSFSVSSSDFHVYFRLSDGMHQLVRHYTGYESSSNQYEYLGLREALAVVRPLLDAVHLEAREPTAEERDFFVESFLTASSRFEDDFAWWVRDRYVTMSEGLGTPELVPALARVVENGLAEAAKETDPIRRKEVLERRMEGPLAAFARQSGWDPRKDDAGAARDLDVVAHEVVDECKRVAVDAPREPR